MPTVNLNSNNLHILRRRSGQYVDSATVEQFGDALKLTGGQTQADIKGRSTVVYGPPLHGFGTDVVPGLRFNDSDWALRFWDATASSLHPSGVYLPLLQQTSTTTGLEVWRKSAKFSGNLWTFWDDDSGTDIVAYTYDGSETKVTSGGSVLAAGSEAVLLDVMPHKDRMVALFAVVDNHIIYHSTDGATWSAAATTPISTNLLADNITVHEDIDGGLLAQAGNEAIAIIWEETNGVITFFSSADNGDVWVDETLNIASSNGPQGAVIYPDIDGVEKLYLATREGVHIVDISVATWTNDLILPMAHHNDNGRGMKVYDNVIWVPHGVDDDESAPITTIRVAGSERIYTSGMGLAGGDGVPASMLGPIRDMDTEGQYLVACGGGGKAGRNAWIIAHNRAVSSDGVGGWHSIVRHGTANVKIEHVAISQNDDATPRLHYAVRTGTGATAATSMKFVEQPFTSPLSGVTIPREATGFIDRPEVNGGMPTTDGALLQYRGEVTDVDSATTGDYFNIDYGVNNATRGSYTNWGDILSGTKTLGLASGAGVQATSFAIRENLIRDDTNPTFDATSEGEDTSGTTITVSHTTADQSNRVLIVGVMSTNVTSEAAGVPTGVTYDSVPMTKLDSSAFTSTDKHVTSMWYLVAPSTGANDIVATFSTTMAEMALVSWTYYGVDQTTPLGAQVIDQSTGTEPSVKVSGLAGDAAVSAINYEADPGDTIAAGSDQTEDHDGITNELGSGGSHQTAATTLPTTALTWTISASVAYALIGVPIKGVSSKTDTPVLRSSEVVYIKAPDALEEFSFTVDIKETARKWAKQPKDVVDALKTAANSKVLVPFSYANLTTTYVKVDIRWGTEPWQSGGSRTASPSDTMNQIIGYADVTVEEIL